MRRPLFGLLKRSPGLALIPFWALTAAGMSVTDLQKQMDRGEKITVLDVRATEVYARGHIPGAINIPASLVPFQNLPPFGRVVVCGEGLGRDTMDETAAALVRRPGITVDILQGGYAAWQSAQGMNTKGRGLTPEDIHYISYADLKVTDAKDVVLVDLRKKSGSGFVLNSVSTQTNAPLTDLAGEFPGMKVSNTPFGSSAKLARVGSRSESAPLLVLIDSGDGTAQAMARSLKSAGNQRFTILAGGEEILARHGQSGLQRKGGTQPLTGQKTPAPRATN